MDDLTFSARRASTAVPVQPQEPTELDARFRTLVQSPLRAGTQMSAEDESTPEAERPL